jgi:hemolysin D
MMNIVLIMEWFDEWYQYIRAPSPFYSAFTRYGTIDAEILHVSNDAIMDEARGLIYTGRVLMKRSVMRVEDRLVNLTPGMAVTVEIKTGKRRLIEYVLSPLLQYAGESVRER